MHAYELRISGLDNPVARSAARCKLLACPEVRDIVRGAGTGRFLVVYEGNWEHPKVWCHLLTTAGFEAAPVGSAGERQATS